MTRSLRLVAAVFLACVIASPGSAQTVRGVVAVVETAEPLAGANVLLVGVEGQANVAVRTNSNGEFLVEARTPGIYVLRVHHIGYKPASSGVLLRADQMVDVQVNMVAVVTALEPVTVYGQRLTPEQIEFESRRDLKYAFTFDRHDIDRLRYAATVDDIVAQGVPGGGASIRCWRVYLDGRESRTFGERYPLDWLYGMEVYLNYTDTPLRYRDPFKDPMRRCGTVLLWSNLTPEVVNAPTVWSAGLGGSVGAERWVSEISWRPGLGDTYVTVARLRAGQYNPADLLGSARAEREELNPHARPPYASIYVGKQGPAPLLPWKRVVYSRVAIGVSGYLGQSSETIPDADSLIVLEPPTASYFGLGGELALGATLPNGAVRPWIEVRAGTEYLMRIGVRWIRPALMVGIEVGGGRGER